MRVVHDVDLDLPRGGWTAVTGPSGSGKSTLLHLAAGLERADAGRVTVAGVGLTAATGQELTELRRDRIGFVFQSLGRGGWPGPPAWRIGCLVGRRTGRAGGSPDRPGRRFARPMAGLGGRSPRCDVGSNGVRQSLRT